jgi:hypothetical protein
MNVGYGHVKRRYLVFADKRMFGEEFKADTMPRISKPACSHTNQSG